MPDSSFLEAQQLYERLDTIDLDASINNLDSAISLYSLAQANEERKTAVKTAFEPIADYYAKLIRVNKMLQDHINKTAKLIADSEPMMTSEERYTNRVYPEESVEPREVMGGFFPELRPSSLPYFISISVFMASLTIFLIFQMNGFNANLNAPPAFYENPKILAGLVVIILIIGVILYFKS